MMWRLSKSPRECSGINRQNTVSCFVTHKYGNGKQRLLVAADPRAAFQLIQSQRVHTKERRTRVYLAAGRTDLRRGIDGLAAQIQTVLREDPFSGHLFIFRGRAAHTIKVLMYDGSGFLLMQKRLTEGKFIWPSPADGIVTISRAQMSLLIDGLDWRAAKARSVAKPLFIV